MEKLGMEIEAKFSVRDREVFEEIGREPALGRFTVVPVGVRMVSDEWLDTRRLRLMRAGLALRVRSCEGEEPVLTLKGEAKPGGKGIHRRLEIEAPARGFSEGRPGTLPHAAMRDLVSAHAKRLHPQVVIRQTRKVFLLKLNDTEVAELSLDEFRFDDSEPHFCVEVELRPGRSESELDEVAVALRARWKLVPEHANKLELAFSAERLLRERKSIRLLRSDTFSFAAKKVLRRHFARMLEKEAAVLAGDSADAVHDMRVATRRLRAALHLFEGAFRTDGTKRFLRGLRGVAQALGVVRDLDVFAEGLSGFGVSSFPELSIRRSKARESLLAHLRSDEYLVLKREFPLFLCARSVGVQDPEDEESVWSRAPALLFARLAETLDAAVSVSERWPAERLHALRIELKRLRYAMEFFEDLLSPDVKSILSTVRGMQDQLGAFHDACVGLDLVEELQRHEVEGLSGFREHLERVRSERVPEFLGAWQHFVASDPVAALAGTISRREE